MWENRDSYNGLSLLPKDNGTYKQAPFNEITKDAYEALMEKFPKDVDFSMIIESDEASVDHVGENIACAGGACAL
jgi:ribonucleoside-diphosphate reductase alpha chain